MKQNNATYSLLATTLVLLMALQAIEVRAEVPAGRGAAPKLIVGITVDQLRTDYIHALEGRLSSGGLKRLMNQGLVFEQVTFNFDVPDATAAMAVLATGTYPFYNGISGQEVYDADKLKRQSVFFDKDWLGYATNSQLSPKALISTTLADELKIASGGTSRSFSIAPNAEEALIGAGHASNCALWLDDKEGKWAGTTYYQEFPKYVVRKNEQQPLSVHLSSINWEPMFRYDGRLDIMPYRVASGSFDHTFYQYGKPVYGWIKTTPIINDAIVEMARLAMHDGKLGNGQNTDMLQLTFYAGTYQHERAETYAEELQDIYLRLDKSIGDLLNVIENEVGLSNAIIYLTGTGQIAAPATEIEGTSAGTFTASRCTSLLNSYLISLYGQGNWVLGYQDNQIFLARNFIERKNIKLAEIQKAAADFVMMFSGVEDVVTQHQILHDDANDRIRRMRRGYNRQNGGDLVLTLQPGWSFKAKDNSPSHTQTRHDVVPGPAIIFAPGIEAEHVKAPIDATAIAPTVAAFIRIRAPSGCTQAPLRLR